MKKSGCRALILLLGLFWLVSVRAEVVMEVVTPKHRLATELVEAIEPLADENIYLQVFGGELILKGPKAEVRSMLQLLESLDQPARNLLIEVRRANQKLHDSSRVSVSGQYQGGGKDEQYRVTMESDGVKRQRRDGTVVEIRGGETSRGMTGSGHQQVRGVEGMPLFIGTGATIPLVARDQWGRVVRIGDQSAVKGFYAIVNFIGSDRVSVAISVRNDQYRPRNGAVALEGVDTRVTGGVGEWLQVGAIHLSSEQTLSGMASRSSGQQFDFTDYQIRVVDLGYP